MNAEPTAVIVFFVTLLLTFGAAIYARLKSQPSSAEEDLAGRSLNRWMIGLSAATTGNSGFIVTGAVGLGYAGGAQWLLLPLGWLIGDIIYWTIFPDKLNRLAHESKAVTLSELLTFDLSGITAKIISVLVALILVVFLSVYTSSQWLAGEKFLGGVFHITSLTALLGFGSVIVLYSAIGGFRGSVYVDTLQAFIRIGGTVLALWVVLSSASAMGSRFWSNLALAGGNFLNPLAGGGLIAATAFMLGYAGAAVGFGLGQPQIVSRYMAGESPQETKAAWWIYILFLQSTWLAMTVFGIVLRGVQPGIADPETGLSLFFRENVGAIATGVIFADVFATIASTSNGLLIAISQTIRRDLLGLRQIASPRITTPFILILGLVTVALSLALPGNVFTLAVSAISMIGAAVAGAVIIKVLHLRHSGGSLLFAIIGGFSAALIWHGAGLSAWFNETAIGIGAALLLNYLTRGRYVQTLSEEKVSKWISTPH